ncbi:MAG: hypothetical protein AAGJ79_07850 [Verrucomicrobiota bacterium]
MHTPLTLVFALLLLTPLTAEEGQGSRLNATVWGGLVFASSDDSSATAPLVEKDLAAQLGKVAAFKDFTSFTLLGEHNQDIIFSDFTNWVVPSNNFNLQFETKGIDEKGSLNLMLKLWQEERVLVKTDATLRQKSPLFIGGPKWRNGRLIFVVVLK